MSNYLDWSNLVTNSVQPTTDAITEREQAFNSMNSGSTDFTDIAVNNTRAITPTTISPYEKRKSELQQATERAKARLGDELASNALARDEMAIASGVDPEQVKRNRNLQTDIKNMSDQERIQNNIKSKTDPLNQNSFYDEDLEHAIYNLDMNQVVTAYSDKPALRDYILSQKGYNVQQLVNSQLYANNDASIFNNVDSILWGATAETSSVIDWARYTGNSLMGADSKELNETITDGLSTYASEKASKTQDTAGQLSDKAVEARRNLTDIEYDKLISLQKSLGLRGTEIDQNTVKRELQKIGDTTSDSYQITREVTQELPSLALTLGMGKVAEKGAVATAKALSKDKIQSHLAKKEAQAIAEQKAKTGLTDDVIKQSAEFKDKQLEAKRNIDAVFKRKTDKASTAGIAGYELISSGSQSGTSSYSDAAEFILNQDDKSIEQSKGFKDLQKENPNITMQEAKEILANRAGEEALLRAFVLGGGSGALFSKAESKLFDRLFKGKSKSELLERAKSYGISVGTNSVQEFIEEGGSKYISNQAINNTLGYEAVNSMRDVISSGAIGAITGATSTTIFNTPELIGSSAKSGVKKLKEIREEKLDSKKANNTVEAFNTNITDTPSTITKETIVTDSKEYYKKQKEASKVVAKVNAGQTITPEEQKVIDDTNNYNEELNEKYEAEINALENVFNGATEIINKISELEDDDSLSEDEKYKQMYAYANDATNKLKVNKSLLENINKAVAQGKTDKERSAYLLASLMELQKVMGNTIEVQRTAKDKQFKGIDAKIEAVSNETTGSNTALSSVDLSNINDSDIEVKGETVSIKGKDYSKEEIINSFTNYIRGFNLEKEIPVGKEQEHLNRSIDQVKKLQAIYNKLGSNGLQTNVNLNPLFNAVERITRDLNSNKISANEARTLQEQLLGSKYKGKVNRGLLHYMKEAILNQGKMSLESRLALLKFIRSQTAKSVAITDMIRKMQNDQAEGKFNPNGYNFTNEETESQLTQSGSERNFKTIEEAKKYQKTVQRIQSEFLNLSGELANKGFSIGKSQNKVTQAQPAIQSKSEPSKEKSIDDINAELNNARENIEDTYIPDYESNENIQSKSSELENKKELDTSIEPKSKEEVKKVNNKVNDSVSSTTEVKPVQSETKSKTVDNNYQSRAIKLGLDVEVKVVDYPIYLGAKYVDGKIEIYEPALEGMSSEDIDNLIAHEGMHFKLEQLANSIGKEKYINFLLNVFEDHEEIQDLMLTNKNQAYTQQYRYEPFRRIEEIFAEYGSAIISGSNNRTTLFNGKQFETKAQLPNGEYSDFHELVSLLSSINKENVSSIGKQLPKSKPSNDTVKLSDEILFNPISDHAGLDVLFEGVLKLPKEEQYKALAYPTKYFGELDSMVREGISDLTVTSEDTKELPSRYIVEAFEAYKKELSKQDEHIPAMVKEVKTDAVSGFSMDRLFSYIDEYFPQDANDMKSDLSKDEKVTVKLFEDVTKEFRSIPASLFKALYLNATKGIGINYKNMLSGLENKNLPPQQLELLRRLTGNNDFNALPADVMIQRLKQVLQSVPSSKILKDKGYVNLEEMRAILNQVSNEISSSIQSNVLVFSTTASLESIANDEQNHEKLINLVHQNLQSATNQKWIKSTSEEFAKTNPDMNISVTYKYGNSELTIPMWLDLEYRNKGIVFDKNELIDLGLKGIKKSIISENYDELLSIADNGDNSKLIKELGLTSAEDISFIYDVATLLKQTREHLYQVIPDLLKDPTKQSYGLGVSGIMNFLQISEVDGKTAVVIPDELVQLLTANVVNALQTMNNLTSSSTKETEDFLNKGGVKLQAFDTSTGSYKNKQIDLDISSLGSNQNNLISQVGMKGIQMLGLKPNQQNTALYQAIVTSLGVESLNLIQETGVLKTQEVKQLNDKDEEVGAYKFVSVNWGKLKENELLNNVVKFSNKDLLNQVLGINNVQNEHQLVGVKDEIGRIEPNTEHVKTEFTSGQNQEVLDYLDVYNNQEWKLDTEFLSLQDKLGKIYDLATDDFDSEVEMTDRAKASATSKAQQLYRAKEKLQDIIEQGKALGADIKDIRIKMQYELMSNSRFNMKSSFNTQNIKYHRESANLVQRDKDGNEIEYSFKVPDLGNQPLGQFAKTANDDVKMFALSLAQALGVKIERKSMNQIFNELDIHLSKDYNKNMLSIISGSSNVPVNAQTKAIAKAFKDEYGNGGHRAMKALMTYHNFINAKSDSDFVSNLFIEADGIGNGMHNIVMQFNTHLSSDMLRSLLKTGVITTDRIAETYEKAKQNNPDITLEKVVDSLEGSAEIFSDDLSSNIPKDVYEDVSNEMASKIQTTFDKLNEGLELLNSYVPHNITNIPKFVREDGYARIEHAKQMIFEKLENEGLTEAERFELYGELNTLNDIQNNINIITVLDLSGSMKNANTKESLLNLNIKEISSKAGNNFVNELVVEISRSFAKAGVTPATYGGKLDGIAQQLIKNVMQDLTGLADKLYRGTGDVEQFTKDWNKFITVLYNIKAVPTEFELHYEKGTKTFSIDVTRLLSGVETTKARMNQMPMKEVVNDLLNMAFDNKGTIESGLKHGTASMLNGAVQSIYGESLGLASEFLAFNEPLFELFHDEFLRKVDDKITERNLKNGWAKESNGRVIITNSKGFDGLSKKEYRNILKTMSNLPVVATAFSNNNTVLDSLVHSGMSNIKTSISSELGKTSISSIYKNNHTMEFLSATVMTQLKDYEQAGASTFTNTVVSNESKAQAKAQQIANKEGKSFLDVFDGGDALAALAHRVGQLLNQESFNAHQNYSVMGSLWNMYNNSELGILAKEVFSKDYNIHKHVFKKDGKTFIDKQTYNGLKLAVSIQQSGSITNKNLNKAINIIKSVLNHTSNPTLDGVEIFESDINTLNNTILVIKSFGLDNLFTQAMEYKADQVAKHKATMAVLKELPIKYNQFAGSTRGISLNTESALGMSIIRDILSNKISNPDELSEYLYSNPELQKIYNDTYQKEKVKLNLNDYSSFAVNTDSISSLLKSLEPRQNNTIQSKTHKVLFDIVKPLIENSGIKLITQEELLEARPDLGTQLSYSKAMYIPNVGLYMPKGITNIDALHELLHVVLKDSIASYVDGTASAKTKSAIGEIISIAKALNNKLEDYETKSLLKELQSSTDPDLNKSYGKVSKLKASVTNLLFAFDPEATKNLTDSQIKNLKYVALQEFVAYTFTENESIAQLAKTNTNRGFKKIFSNIVDYFKKIHKQILRTFGLSGSEDFANTALIEGLTSIQVLANKQSNNSSNKQALSSYKDLSNMGSMISGSNNSPEFKGFLNDLTRSIRNSVQELYTESSSILGNVNDYPAQLATFVDDDLDTNAKTYLAGLRSTGIKVTNGEEVAFTLMNKLLKINRSLGNVSNLEQGNTLLQAVAEKITPNRFMGQNTKSMDRYKAVFHKDTDYSLALLLTNETFRNEVLKHTSKGISIKGNNIHKWLKDSPNTEKLLDFFAQYNDQESLNRLANSLAQIDTRNALKASAYINQRIEEERANNRDMELTEQLYKILGKDTKIGNLFGNIGAVSLSGKDRLTYSEREKPNDESSLIGKILDAILTYDVSEKGRTTMFSTFMSWLLGEREDTHRIHAMHSEHLTNIDKIRERVVKVTKEGIKEFFKSEPSEEENGYINTMFRTNLHGLLSDSSMSIHELNLINDSQFRNDKLNQYEREIRDLLNREVQASDKVKDQIYNYLVWQSNGLADLQRDNEAKAMEVGLTHGILPNTRAISSLVHLTGVLNFKKSDNLSTELNNLLQARTALISFSGLNQDEQDSIVNYINQDKKGIYKLLQNSKRIHEESFARRRDSMLGRDGYVVAKQDPHYDLQIVDNNDTQSYDRLRKLGYVMKAKLANGELVMSTDGALSNRYKTGMFSLTEYTLDGMNTNDYSIQGITSLALGHKHSANIDVAYDKQLVRALNDKDYYSKLNHVSNYQPVINEDGEVVRYEASVPYSLSNELVPNKEQGYESLANLTGRTTEEMITAKENKRYVDILRDLYNSSPNKKEFIQISPNFTVKGNMNLDKQFQKKVRNIYMSLPQDTRDYIDNNGGLYIPIKEVNNILGYHETWLSDVFTGKSYFPEPVQVAIKGVANMFGSIAGVAPAKAIRVFEEYLKETTSLSKDYILNRSLTVPFANLLSNVLHLVQWGINPLEIPKLMKEGYNNAIQYQKYMNELDKINFLLRQGTLSSVHKLKYETKQKQLQTLIKNSPVHSLVQGGILTSITALEVGGEETDNSRLGKLEEKLGLTNVYDNVPEIVKSILLKKDSKAHDFFIKTLDYGDFVAKYALYKHLKRKGKSEHHAMNIIREEFINYSANRGAFFDWMNGVGLTWFLNYKLGIQKIIFRSFRRNFLRTAAMMSTDSFVAKSGVDPLGLYQTVPSQYIGIGNVLPFGSYQTSPHLIDGFESHYVARLIEALL